MIGIRRMGALALLVAAGCGPKMTAPQLAAALKSPKAGVREDAANDVRRLKDPKELEDELLAALEAEKDSKARCAMLQSIGSTGSDQALEVMVDAKNGDDEYAATCASRGLSAWSAKTGWSPSNYLKAPWVQVLRDAPDGPAVFGPLKNVTWMMPADELKDAAPEFEKNDAKVGDVNYSLNVDDGVINRARVYFGEVEMRERLSDKWGEGEKVKGSGTVTAWYNPEERVRFVLEEDSGRATMAVSPYTPVERLAKDGELGEPLSALFTSSRGDTKKKFAAFIESEKEDGFHFYLAPTNFGEYSAMADVQYKGDDPVEVELVVSCSLQAGCQEQLFEALEAAYGEPKMKKVDDKQIRFYRESGPEITAWKSSGDARMRVSKGKSGYFY